MKASHVGHTCSRPVTARRKSCDSGLIGCGSPGAPVLLAICLIVSIVVCVGLSLNAPQLLRQLIDKVNSRLGEGLHREGVAQVVDKVDDHFAQLRRLQALIFGHRLEPQPRVEQLGLQPVETFKRIALARALSVRERIFFLSII